MDNIGKRIKEFRVKKGVSQLDLEFEIGAASGSLSRIESQITNPTKETLNKIFKALKLNKSEINYILSLSSSSVTTDEIREAKQTIHNHFAKNETIAFLLDDHWNLIELSEGFVELLKLSDKDIIDMIGRNIMEILLNPSTVLCQKINNSYYEQFCKYILSRKRLDMIGFEDEQWVISLLDNLSKFPIFSNLWPDIKDNPIEYFSNESRTMYFNVEGSILPMLFGREVLKNCPRFYIIEFSYIRS